MRFVRKKKRQSPPNTIPKANTPKEIDKSRGGTPSSMTGSYSGSRLVVRSSVLDEDIIFCLKVGDDGGTPRDDGRAVYLAEEINILSGLDLQPEDVLAIHKVKRAFTGRVVWSGDSVPGR